MFISALSSHDYILKIVPTIYEKLDGTKHFSYQYTWAHKVLIIIIMIIMMIIIIIIIIIMIIIITLIIIMIKIIIIIMMMMMMMIIINLELYYHNCR